MSFRLIPFFLATLSLPAQQPSAPTASDAVLTVRTNQERVVRVLLAGAALPDRPAAGHWVLTMDGARQWSCTPASGEAPAIELRARPPRLMEAFQAEIDSVQRLARTSAALFLKAWSVKSKDAVDLVDAGFALPRQIDVLSLVVRSEDDSKFDVHLELQPFAGSVLAAFTAALRHSQRGGVPESAGHHAVEFAMDADLPSLRPFVRGLEELLLGVVPTERREAARSVLAASWGVYDGTMAFGFGGAGASTLTGVRDPAKLAELMATEDWRALQSAFEAPSPSQVVKTEAIQLGGVSAWRTEVSGESSPMIPSGKVVGYSAVVGDLAVALSNVSQEQFEAQLQRAGAGKWPRRPLPGGAMLAWQIDGAAIQQMLPPDRAPAAELPFRLAHMQLGKRDASLTLDAHVER